jgi:hypothetical protein
MKRIPVICATAAVFCVCQGVASAQAMVENALGAGRAATSTAPMSGLGKSVGGIAGGLEKTLKKGTSSPAAHPMGPLVTARVAPTAVVVPEVHYDDPRTIESGIPYDELLRKFGPATLEITTSPLTKTLSYVHREGAIQVEMREGKVTSMVAQR